MNNSLATFWLYRPYVSFTPHLTLVSEIRVLYVRPEMLAVFWCIDVLSHVVSREDRMSECADAMV